jgi:hypothetical protein
MATYILNERDEAIPVDWEDYAAWWCANRDQLTIASNDVRDSKRRYVTTVRTRFRGNIGSVTEVWLTETTEGDLSKSAATRKEALENHKRCIKYLENCYCRH